jgi:hypothetical protein
MPALLPIGSLRVAVPIDLGQVPVVRVAGFFVPTKPSQCERRDGYASCNNQKRHEVRPSLPWDFGDRLANVSGWLNWTRSAAAVRLS